MMWIKRIVIALLIIVALAVMALLVTGNSHILRGLPSTYFSGKSKPDIYDMEYFDVSTIPADKPEAWPLHARYNQYTLGAEDQAKVDSFETTALLVFYKDSLLFEKYYLGATDTTHSNSFSMAKSFTAMLIGKAIDEGYIQSVDQKVGDFLPEFKSGKNAELTIRHLLTMTSGIPFGESYASPFGYMAKAYFGKDLTKETMGFSVERDPGTLWAYEGGNTVLLGMIVKQATGRTPSRYFFEKFWSCIGAQHTAYWNLDHENGLEKTFTGFYSTARDFARIGQLYMHRGIHGVDTLLSPSFVDECLTPCNVPDDKGENCYWYGYQWWLGQHEGDAFFSCRGMRGQYIIGIPSKDLLIVRLGHQQSPERTDHMPPDLYNYISTAKLVSSE